MKMQCVACVLIATIYLVSPVESWLCSPYNRYVLANTTGVTFSSPLYPTHPNSYMMNLYCKWIVRSNTPGRSVIMKIIDANIANSTNCESVFVKSYEGMSPRGPLLNTFCGSELPPPIKSSSGDIFVEFKIASGAKGQGFVAKIYEVPNPTTDAKTMTVDKTITDTQSSDTTSDTASETSDTSSASDVPSNKGFPNTRTSTTTTTKATTNTKPKTATKPKTDIHSSDTPSDTASETSDTSSASDVPSYKGFPNTRTSTTTTVVTTKDGITTTTTVTKTPSHSPPSCKKERKKRK